MTRRFLSLFALAVTGWLATPCARGGDTTNPAPDFKEVYDLLRTNLTGATDDELNRAAIEGLLSRFPGKVSLVGGAADGSALSKSAIIENNVAYLRVVRQLAIRSDLDVLALVSPPRANVPAVGVNRPFPYSLRVC